MKTKKAEKSILFLPYFQKFITSSATGRRVTPSGKRISKGTIEQYECIYKLVCKYELTLSAPIQMPLIHRSSLRDLQKHKLYWKRFYRGLLQFIYKNNYYDQYANSVLKTIKTFFNYLINEKNLPVGNFHKQFVIPSEKLIPVVLEPYQLKFLITDVDFHNSLSKALQKTKDIFVFGCTVGLRYSDLMSLKRKHLQATANGMFIVLNTQKTATLVKIPLPDYITDIVEKYKKSNNQYLLPRLANSNMNLQIKLVIEKAGWTYNLTKIRNRQGKAIEVKTNKNISFRFCDHITSHTMRRTAITTLLMMGVPESMVRKISGHAAGSKEFYKYVSIVQDYLNDEVKNAYKKLLAL